jgi:hypothetical protein
MPECMPTLLTLNQILQGASTATPANPQSGNVLGYFSAHTLRQRRLLVPQL